MRTRAGSGRVPGFSEPAHRITNSSTRRVESDGAAGPKAGTRQLNVRVLAPLSGRYKRLVRDLDDGGFETSLTKLTHALLYAGPQTPEQARRAVKHWRRALDSPD